MRWLYRLAMLFQMLFRRGRERARLNEELQFHLDQQIAENIAAGMSTEQARHAAMRSFGNPAALRDQTQNTWNWNWVEQYLRDIRIGIRTVARTPGFAIVSILVIAIGIGANISVFTIVRSVLLKPLPFKDPDQLVMLYGRSGADKYNVVAAGDFYEWQRQTDGFEQMAIWRWSGYAITNDKNEMPEELNSVTASWNIFSTLGVQPVLGRSFSPEDDTASATNTAIIAWSFFQRRFNGDPSILGKNIRLNDRLFTVIGVLPKWFTYPDPLIQLWTPFHIDNSAENLQSHFNHMANKVIARLKPGVSAEQATQETNALQYQIHQSLSAKGPVADGVSSRRMLEDVVENAKTPLYVLLSAVGCLLLIACLNISNLLVARAAARRQEIAIRAALGGRRLRLCREQLTESLLICLIGGILGVALAFSATRWLAAHWTDMPRADAIRLDGAVCAFAVAITFLSAIIAGLLPALSATGSSMLTALQDSSKNIGGSSSRAALRKTLLTVEIALTVVLLVCGGLLFKSFLRLRSVDLGCTTHNVLTMAYFLHDTKYDTAEKVVAFHTQLLDRVRHLPDVLGVGLTSVVPGDGYYEDRTFTIREHPPLSAGQHDSALMRDVDPGYFSAIQIPLIKGRFFSEDERLERDKYVIVSQKFVREFFPGEDPIHKHLHTIRRGGSGEDYEIIGVVGDVIYSLKEDTKPTMYFPMWSGIIGESTDATLVLRTGGNPDLFALPVQKEISQLDPSLPASRVLTMDQIIGRSTADSSFRATLVLAFAGLSLVLAAVGLYGVLSYLVAQRTAEMGIRIALGARRDQVMKLVLLDGLHPALIGLTAGVPCSFVSERLIRSVLFGTRPLDLSVFVSVMVTLLLVALVACALPAWRASRIDPMQALRTE
jgi:predicted permease